MSVSFEPGHIRLVYRDRTATLGSALEDDEIVIDLDQLTHWDAPDEAIEVTLEDIIAITQMIEAEADRLGLDVAFA